MNAEKLAREFHEIYESKAPDYGSDFEPTPFDPRSRKDRLLIDVCREILETFISPAYKHDFSKEFVIARRVGSETFSTATKT